MIVQNLQISDPFVLSELFKNIISGDVIPSSRLGCPCDVSFRAISPQLSLIWGSYSHMSGAWQTSGGVYITISVDDVPFYFNGKSIGNSNDPLEVTLTYAHQHIDYSFKESYRSMVIYIDSSLYAQTYQNLLGEECDLHQQSNLFSFYTLLEKNQLLELLLPMTYGSSSGDGVMGNASHVSDLADTILERLILGLDFGKPNMLDRTSCQYLGLQAHTLLLAQPFCRLSLELVAQTLKAPLRSIQQGFSDLYGMSIIEYHQKFRLLCMRNHIRKHGPNKISQVAKKFGFHHAGRISQIYKDAFGESPSKDTLGDPASLLHDLGFNSLPAVGE